jgi:hypothetical protein
MQMHRNEILSSVGRRAQHVKKTTGRLAVSAVGFGVAYYFDAENGSARRMHLGQMLRRTARQIDAALTTVTTVVAAGSAGAPGAADEHRGLAPLVRAIRGQRVPSRPPEEHAETAVHLSRRRRAFARRAS